MNVALGILLIAIGIGTLWAQIFTTLASVYFLGWVLIVAGVAQFFYGVTSGSVRKTLFFTLTGLASTLIGLLAVVNPALSAITFTLFIAMLLLFSGIYRIISSIITREDNWMWSLAGGGISLILAVGILLTWPVSGLFIIGLFVAAELIINGVLLVTQPVAYYEEELEYPTSHYLAGVKGGKAKKREEKNERNKNARERKIR